MISTQWELMILIHREEGTAALLLVAAGDHPDRLRSEAAWAHLCAVAPIPASSGKTARRRLNPAGDRQANHALWRIVITRMSSHPPTRAYVKRRSAEGLSKKEIMRCLKRYVAREVYPHLRHAGGGLVPGAGGTAVEGRVRSRYAGTMLLHAFGSRAGAPDVLAAAAGLPACRSAPAGGRQRLLRAGEGDHRAVQAPARG